MPAALRLVLLGLALAALAGPVHAQRKYAVLSAIGDRLTVVYRVMATGSNIDNNRRENMDLAGPGLDNAALLAAEDGLKSVDKSADVVLLAPRTPLAVSAAAAARDGSVPQWIASEARPQLASLGVTHVVLISKYRADARLRITSGSTGSGKLEGLGFYVDAYFNQAEESSSGSSRGFLAVYAYMTVRLFDVQTGAQVAEQIVTASDSAIPGADKERAWDAMTPEQKVSTTRALVIGEVTRAAAALPRR
jgi:hypothetical protein